ncbi:type I methionyl aminopeptidase [Candidatus Poribacteria bacterium]|nr:type I methionyl aminopeptidase [Candidatus Poribacteria bacterium]
MIPIKTKEEIELMRKSAQVVSEVIMAIAEQIRPGVTTKSLDSLARRVIRKNRAYPSFLGYTIPGHPPYPGAICASVNEVVIHGIPSNDTVLRSGDILSVDVGARLKGYHGDRAFTFPVGEISEEARRLLRVTREALYKGIEQAKPGNRLGDICHAIQRHVESHGYSVIRDFVGHGIGREMHEEPQIPNFGKPGVGPKLKPGMVLAIEPMVSAGDWRVVVLEDGWTVVTADGSLSAHFEHTVAILSDGPEILTLPDPDIEF